MDYLQISYYLNRPNATWDSRYLSFHHLSLTSLCPDFFRGTIIIEAQTKQVLWEVAADMIVIKILAAPFVVALTLLVAIVSFLYCVASLLCSFCAVSYRLRGTDPAGPCPVHRRPNAGRRGVPCTGVPRFALWHPGHR